MNEAEKKTLSVLINEALARNYRVSVFDSVNWTVKDSLNAIEIFKGLAKPKEKMITFRTWQGHKLGTFYFKSRHVHTQVKASYTGNEICLELWNLTAAARGEQITLEKVLLLEHHKPT